MIRVLLVEDDVRLAAALTDALQAHGFETTWVSTAAEAVAAESPDVVLLDLGLPDGDGLDVIGVLRSRFDTAGVGLIVVTARGQHSERVAGLRAGADDYVVKPLALGELIARIEAVLRRSGPSAPPTLALGPVTIDLAARRLTRDGEEITLTQKELDLLIALAQEPGVAVPRERLMLKVWQTVWHGTERTLEVHVGTLRHKLGDPALIETVRKVGYRLVVPDAGTSPGAREAEIP